MKNVNITGPSGITIAPGGMTNITTDAISVRYASGIVNGGVMISTEGQGPYRLPLIEVLDFQKYSEFSITVPASVDKGEYSIEFYLTAEDTDGAEERYRYTSGPLLNVQGEVSGDSVIQSVSPKRITQKDMKSTLLVVRGENLTKINVWYLRGRGKRIPCKPSAAPTDTMVGLRLIGSSKTELGYYWVTGRQAETAQVINSPIPIEIE